MSNAETLSTCVDPQYQQAARDILSRVELDYYKTFEKPKQEVVDDILLVNALAINTLFKSLGGIVNIQSTCANPTSFLFDAAWTHEAMADMSISEQLKNECIRALTYELCYEYHRFVLRTMMEAAADNQPIVIQGNTNYLVTDTLHQLPNAIMRAARRLKDHGGQYGNFVVTSPMGVCLLQTLRGDISLQPPADKSTRGPSDMIYAGTLSHSTEEGLVLDVYSSLSHKNYATDMLDVEQFLVGVNSAATLSVDKLVKPTSIVVNPTNFQPVLKLQGDVSFELDPKRYDLVLLHGLVF